MKILGICGPSYCGSTLVNTMLGCLDGVTALGETHWALQPGTVHFGEQALDRGYCIPHGPECHLWTPEVLADLRAGGRADWFPRLAAYVPDAHTLVSSDKNANQWLALGMPDMALFTFKAPWAMLDSFITTGHDPDTALQMLKSEWERLFDLTEGIPRVSMSLEQLVRNPGRTMQAVCDRLGLTFNPVMLQPWDSDQCFFGGNPAWPKFGKEFALETGVQERLGDTLVWKAEEQLRPIYVRLGTIRV